MAGDWFVARLQAKRTEQETQHLYTALTDLCWLVERLTEAHPYSSWRSKAEAELVRVQDLIGL